MLRPENDPPIPTDLRTLAERVEALCQQADKRDKRVSCRLLRQAIADCAWQTNT